jgi:hypothetical protein
MAMTRYTSTEPDQKLQVLTPEQHEAAEKALHRMGKTSAADLTDDQRENLRVSLDEAQ